MEESYFAQKRNIKRRLMEISGNQVGAQVRRLHVIYFLSRNGRIEHPHLIRVHHLSRNGVHLRDVKRWLSELRGKDLPESFAWSYKRRYKSGYVWQDLLDEDLITPISDNEYVLKGSEIPSSSPKEDSNMGKKYPMQKEEEDSTDHSPSSQEEHHRHHREEEEENKRQEARKMITSSPEIIEEESQTFGSEKSSTLTDDHQYQDQEKQIASCDSKHEIHEEIHDKIQPASSYEKNISKKKKGNIKKLAENDVASEGKNSSSTSTPPSSTSSQPSFSKSRSYSNGASHLFRNLITCGAIDTNDSAMVTINRRNKQSLNVRFSPSDDQDSSGFSKELLHKGDKLGGSQRVVGTNMTQQRQPSGRKSFDGVRASPKNSSEFGSQKANPAYKPIYGPQCSQCGKPFKPERLHAHMKSCKGMKARAKYSSRGISAEDTAKNAVESSAESQAKLQIPGYFLTHQ